MIIFYGIDPRLQNSALNKIIIIFSTPQVLKYLKFADAK